MSLQNVLLLNFTFRHTIVLLSLLFGPSGQLVSRSHDVLSFMDVLPIRYDIPSLFLGAVLLTGIKTAGSENTQTMFRTVSARTTYMVIPHIMITSIYKAAQPR